MLLVLGAELLATLALRLAVGAPPTGAATLTATAVAPIVVPAPPTFTEACDASHAAGGAPRVCARF